MLYHYIWKYKMFGRKLRLTNGASLEILNPGRHNNDAGPDFFNAGLKIDGVRWAGDVEIHVKASDWHNHGHDNDSAYNSVVLHAVGVSDTHIKRHDGSTIPQVELTMPEEFFHTYARLAENINTVKCGSNLSELSLLNITDWLESLSVERLQTKANRVTDILKSQLYDWEQTCFVMLARSLGFGLNGEPFERLAQNLPLKYLHHHCDNLMQLEALLFGQAGMLDTSVHIFDEYYQTLANEYIFLAKKYSLRPMQPNVWKYMRTRPHNFPHRRIAMLAQATLGGFKMFGRIIDCKGDIEKLRQLFKWKLDGYWLTHSDFDVTSTPTGLTLSPSSIDLLLINLVSPLYYAYGSMLGDSDIAEYGIKLLEQLPPERNGIINQWRNNGINADNAQRSQALIQLRKEYCDMQGCFKCRFGYNLLSKSAKK